MIALVVIFDALRINISEFGNLQSFNKKQNTLTNQIILAKIDSQQGASDYNR